MRAQRICLGIFVFLTVLGPDLKLAEALPRLRPELLVLPVCLLLGHFRFEFSDKIPLLLMAFFGIAVLAIGASYTVFGVPFDSNDFSVFPMLIQYWVVYSFAKGMARSGGARSVIPFLLAAAGLAALVGFGQKWNLMDINTWLTPHYLWDPDSERGQWTMYKFVTESEYARVIGTVGDPRHFAYVLALGVGGGVAWVQHSRRGSFALFCGLGATFASLVCLYFTQSRTGLASLLVIFLTSSTLYYRRTGNLEKPMVAGLIFLAVGLVGWWQFVDSGVSQRLLMSPEEMMESSGYARQRDFFEVFVRALDNPLILITGMGPAKAVLPGSEHSEFGWVSIRFGFGGLAVYVSMIYFTVRRALRLYRSGKKTDQLMTFAFFSQVMGVWCLYWVAESIFKNPQLMSLNMLAIGLIWGTPLRRGKLKPSARRGRTRSLRRTAVATPVPEHAPTAFGLKSGSRGEPRVKNVDERLSVTGESG